MAHASEEVAFAQVEADLDLPAARVRVIRYRCDRPVDVAGRPGGFRLALGLLPRPRGGSACFADHWGQHRFEPLGDLYLIPPGERFRARGACTDNRSIVCEFEPETLGRWLDAALCRSSRSLERHLDIASPAIRASLLRLHDEIRAPGLASDSLCELLTMQAALDLARHCGAAEPPAAGGLAPWRLRRIDERLADSAAAPSLAELAGLCGLSVRQLTRGYRASRGRSIGDDIARSRIDHARRLLAAGAAVKQVAHALGFNAPANFSAAFARATGESPRRYRERVVEGR